MSITLTYSSINTSASNVETQISEVASDLASYEVANNNALLNITTNIQNITGQISSITGRLTVTEANITSLQSRVTITEANITSLQSRVTINEANITVLNATCVSLVGRGGSNYSISGAYFQGDFGSAQTIASYTVQSNVGNIPSWTIVGSNDLSNWFEIDRKVSSSSWTFSPSTITTSGVFSTTAYRYVRLYFQQISVPSDGWFTPTYIQLRDASGNRISTISTTAPLGLPNFWRTITNSGAVGFFDFNSNDNYFSPGSHPYNDYYTGTNTLGTVNAMVAGRVTDVEANVTALQNRSTVTEANVTALQNRSTVTEANVTALQNRVTVVEANVTLINATLSNVSNRVSTVETLVNSPITGNAALYTLIWNNSNSDVVLGARVTTLEATVSNSTYGNVTLGSIVYNATYGNVTVSSGLANVSGVASVNAINIANVSGVANTNSIDILNVSGVANTNSINIANVSGVASANAINIANVSGVANTNSIDILNVSGVASVNTVNIANVSGVANTNSINILNVSGVANTNSINILNVSGIAYGVSNRMVTNFGTLDSTFPSADGKTYVLFVSNGVLSWREVNTTGTLFIQA
jgi:predicted  nucleic acid-binding Zn-ribbon protein